MKPVLWCCLLMVLGFQSLHAQEARVYQLSGMVLTADAEPYPIPYVNVYIKKRQQGTAANAEGFFSLAVSAGDSVTFSALGFKTQSLFIPDSLKSRAYLAKIHMMRDTTILDEVSLYPWPTRERLNRELLAMKVPTTELDLAMRNLAMEEIKSRAAAMGYDAEEISNYVIKSKEQEIYNNSRYYGPGASGGAAIMGALSNPFAWAAFFDSLNRNKKK